MNLELRTLGASWFVGRTAGFAVALLGAASGAIATSLDPGEITPRLIGWNAVVRFATFALVVVLASGERRSRRLVEQLASVDALTQLFNRRRFYEAVDSEFARARRAEYPVALAYIDVDDLKQRNDTLGHEAGDAMLAQFAEVVRSTIRVTDTAARLGGDEFSILLPATDTSAAELMVRRLQGRLDRAAPLPIKISCGIVAVSADHELEVEAVVHAADELMMQAKRAGKGQYRVRRSPLAPAPAGGVDPVGDAAGGRYRRSGRATPAH